MASYLMIGSVKSETLYAFFTVFILFSTFL